MMIERCVAWAARRSTCAAVSTDLVPLNTRPGEWAATAAPLAASGSSAAVPRTAARRRPERRRMLLSRPFQKLATLISGDQVGRTIPAPTQASALLAACQPLAQRKSVVAGVPGASRIPPGPIAGDAVARVASFLQIWQR